LKIKVDEKILSLIDLLGMYEINKVQIKYYEIIKWFFLNYQKKKQEKDYFEECIILKLLKLLKLEP
jgi:hypothetical protein